MKRKIENFTLLLLMTFAITHGFSSVYIIIWCLAGLPYTWWATVITSVLGGLSAWGLFKWCERMADDA